MSTGTYCPLAYSLFMAAILLAIKYNEDVYYDNEFYSKVGGLSCTELNGLEGTLLDWLDFDVHVSSEHYQRYLASLGWTQVQPMEDIGTEDKSKPPFIAISSEASMKTVSSSNELSREEAH